MKSKDTSKEALNEICNECNQGDCDKKYGACPNFMKVWNDLERLEKYEKYIPQLIEGHKKLQSAMDWGNVADSAFLIRTALEKIGVIEEE